MANVDELMKLNREQLNDFASSNGVTDAEKFENKRQLAEAVSPRVTDEQLNTYVEGQKADGSDNQDDTSNEDDSSEDSGENEDGANDADAVGVGDDPYSVKAGGADQSEDDNGDAEEDETPAEAPYDENDPNNTENGRVDTTASGTPGAPQNEDMEHMDGIAHPR